MDDIITHAFLCGIYCESVPGAQDLLSDRAEEVLSDFLVQECGLSVSRYQIGDDAPLSKSLSARTLPDGALARSEVLSSLLRWLDRISSEGVTDCLIYFCGHGFVGDGGFALITRDTKVNYTSETGLSLAFVYHVLRKYEEKGIRFLLLIDACMAGSTKRFLPERLPKNVSTIFTTKRGEVATQAYGSIFIDNFIQSVRSSTAIGAAETQPFARLSDTVRTLEQHCGESGFDQFLSHADEILIPCQKYSVSGKLETILFTWTANDLMEADHAFALTTLEQIIAELSYRYSTFIKRLKISSKESTILLEFSCSSPLAHLTLVEELYARLPIFSSVRLDVRKASDRKLEEIKRSLCIAFKADFFSSSDDEAPKFQVKHNDTTFFASQIDNVFDLTARRSFRGMSAAASLVRSGHYTKFIHYYLSTMEPNRS